MSWPIVDRIRRLGSRLALGRSRRTADLERRARGPRVRQGSHVAYVLPTSEGVRVVKDGRAWRGTFEEVEHLAFSPAGELFACVIRTRGAGETFQTIGPDGTRSFWHGPHDMLRDGRRLGFATVAQWPLFWRGHALWVRSVRADHDPERSQVVFGAGRLPGGAERHLDNPRRLALEDDDVLAVSGVHYTFDDDKGRLMPFRAVIQYRLRESGKGIAFDEVEGSYGMWSER
jgi:hypothetical protein